MPLVDRLFGLEPGTTVPSVLTDGELVAHYQPIVDLRSSAVVGYEALARWSHPDGLLLPASFLPAVEVSGLIPALGNWVLADACLQLRDWGGADPTLEQVFVTVNVSARQVTPGLARRVEDALASASVSPERLWLELNEQEPHGWTRAMQRELETVRELGVRLALDDFGVGEASLVLLREAPFDALKIDQRFVFGIDEDPKNAAIVSGIVDLAGRLGIMTFAEGVEAESQREVLADLGCDAAQGYLFGEPAAPEDVASVP